MPACAQMEMNVPFEQINPNLCQSVLHTVSLLRTGRPCWVLYRSHSHPAYCSMWCYTGPCAQEARQTAHVPLGATPNEKEGRRHRAQTHGRGGGARRVPCARVLEGSSMPNCHPCRGMFQTVTCMHVLGTKGEYSNILYEIFRSTSMYLGSLFMHIYRSAGIQCHCATYNLLCYE